MLTSPGIGSGLDIESIVTQLITLEGTPTRNRLDRREATFQAELSALGSFRSALDTFNGALEKLQGLDEFARAASSSDEEIFTVTSGETSAPGSYDLEIVRLAQPHKLASSAFADAGTQIGTGTLEIELSGVGEGGSARSFSVNFDTLEDATLGKIRDAINAASENPGVEASIINADDGAHLVLRSTQTGADKTIRVTTSGGDGGLEQLVYDPLTTTNLTEVQAALDAHIRIDNFDHFSATDTITDAIDGVTINLLEADPGTTHTLSNAIDKEQIESLVDDFVDAYNGLVTTVRDLTSYDAETRIGGALQGDSLVSSMMGRLSREFNKAVFLPLTSLRDIGVSVGLDGKLSVDGTTLSDVINNDLGDFRDLFDDPNYGVAVRMGSVVEEFVKSDGLLDVRTQGLQSSIDSIGDQRERLAQRLVSVEERLRAQFTALDSLIAGVNSTSSFLSAQLANLPSPSALVGSGQG